jgi:hypothetical protein
LPQAGDNVAEAVPARPTQGTWLFPAGGCASPRGNEKVSPWSLRAERRRQPGLSSKKLKALIFLDHTKL